MFGKKRDDNGEKLYRYSIRKYHFGAASVAIAALIFFANGVAKADMPVSPATANTEKVGVAVTGLTEGVPPTEGHSEKSQEVGSEKEAIAKKSVDKSALNQALSDLQAEIAKIDNGKLSSLASQISQLTDESKRLLGDENTSEEAVATLVGRVQAMTEQVRQLQSKENGKEVEDNSLNSKQDSISDKDNEKNTPAVKDKIVEDKRTAVLNKKSTELSAGTESKTITVSEESYIVKEGKVKKELPTYTNEGDGVYKLKDELEFIYKTLEKAGADQSKIQATKEAYDKFNEVFSRGETISQEDFEAAVLNLKKSREIIESVLKDKSSQASVDEMINSQPRSSDEELPSRNRGRTRTARSTREGSNTYENSREYYFEDGKKGVSPYDRYTYVFYSSRQSGVISDGVEKPVEKGRDFIYADVTPTRDGFRWDIYINRAKYDLSDTVGWFTVPKGANVDPTTVNISWSNSEGNHAISPNDGKIESALKQAGLRYVTKGTTKASGINKAGNNTPSKKYYSQDLKKLATEGGPNGNNPYKFKLLDNNAEGKRLQGEKVNVIYNNNGDMYYFEQDSNRTSYHLSFETKGETDLRKLVYAVGMKGDRRDEPDNPTVTVRFIANQWSAKTKYENTYADQYTPTITYPAYIVKQGEYNNQLRAYNENWDRHPERTDKLLTYGYDAAHRSDFDANNYYYFKSEGGKTSENILAEANGKGFNKNHRMYRSDGTEITKREMGTRGADRPGDFEYTWKWTFDDGSVATKKVRFIVTPTKPTLASDLSQAAGKKNVTIKATGGTQGVTMELYRKVGDTLTKVASGVADSKGEVDFVVKDEHNAPKVLEEGDYVVKTVVDINKAYRDYAGKLHTRIESEVSNVRTATDGVPPTVKLINRTDGNKEAELSDNENNLPMVTVYRGAVLELPLKYYDNATTGKVNISYVNNNGIPRGVWFNKDINANQNVNISETGKTEKAQGEYTVRGRVAANADLGTRIVTLKVSDDSNGNVENGNKKLVKFKVRVVDLEFENRGTEVNATTRADVLGLGENSVDPNNYLRTTDGENVHNDSYFPSDMKFRYLNGKNLSETVSFDKIGKHSVKARAYFPDDPRAKELPTNPNDLTGDISPVARRGYLERTIEFNVRPNAPTLTDAQFYGTAGRRPDVTVSGLPTDSQLQNGASVTVELYQGDRKVASKIVS